MPRTRSKSPRLHPNALRLVVANVRNTVRFYTEKLGFKLVAAFPDADKPLQAELALNGQAISVGELPSLQEARQLGFEQDEIEVLKQDARAIARGTLGTGVSYGIRVANVDALARRLKKARVKLLLAPKTHASGLRDCQVADLDGYRLVFYERRKEAPRASE